MIMMGARGRSAISKQEISKRSIESQRIDLLPASSDGIEGSCSSSSGHSCESGAGSVSEMAYLHGQHTHQHPQLQRRRQTSSQTNQSDEDGIQMSGQQIFSNLYASNSSANNNNSDNSIYLVSRAVAPLSRNDQPPAAHLRTSLNDSLNEASTNSSANLGSPINRQQQQHSSELSKQQEQHRRLQYQVHQQLQRIYGNSAAGQQMNVKQSAAVDRHHKIYQAQHRSPTFVDLQGKAHISEKAEMEPQQVTEFLHHHHPPPPHRNQHPHPPHHHHPSQHQHQIHNHRQLHPNRLHHQFHAINKGHHHSNCLEAIDQNNNIQMDQTYDSLSSASDSKQAHLGENFFVKDEGSAPVGGHLHHAPNCTLPEERDENLDNDRLDPQQSAALKMSHERKTQLDELHYATVTAAALLSATASAAAAFAAVDRQLGRPAQPPAASTVNSANINQALRRLPARQPNELYSQAYQDIARRNNRYESQAAALAHLKRQQHRKQLQGRAGPIYADADFIGRRLMQPQQVYILQAPNQSQLPVYQEYRAPPPLPPPQPPIRRPLVQQQVQQVGPRAQLANELLRQQRIALHLRSQQLPKLAPSLPAPIPALAVVHKGGKSASAKAELIGRMLVNNILAAQRAKLDPGQHYVAAAKGKLLVDQQGREFTYALAPGAAIQREKLTGGGVFAGSHQQPADMFAIPNVGLAGAANLPSDSIGGHSNAPLVLDRKLKPVGFVERVCQIDLTIFWWSLLLVSFLFIGTVVAISRYIF